MRKRPFVDDHSILDKDRDEAVDYDELERLLAEPIFPDDLNAPSWLTSGFADSRSTTPFFSPHSDIREFPESFEGDFVEGGRRIPFEESDDDDGRLPQESDLLMIEALIKGSIKSGMSSAAPSLSGASSGAFSQGPFPHASATLSTRSISPVSLKEAFLMSSFAPSDLHDIDAALQANQECQAAVRATLDAIERDIVNNAAAIRNVKDIYNQQVIMASAASDEVPLKDPFTLLEKVSLDEHKRARFEEMHRRFLLLQRDHRWSPKQRKVLAKAVRVACQRLLTDEVMDRRQESRDLTILNRELEGIREMTDDQLATVSTTRPLDWNRIAQSVNGKSAIDCCIQWLNVDVPLINRDPKWAKPELLALQELGHPSHGLTWQQVADRLGTNRTAFACAVEYQSRFAPHCNRGRWTPEEDTRLREAVAQYGDSDWTRIAAVVPGRTAHQCVHRWRKALSPDIRRGKWTPEEDALLREGVRRYGIGNWHRIHTLVPGRTDVQCRERWTNVLDPGILRAPFSREEDDELATAVKEVGEGKWATVALRLPGRTDNQCWRRWKQIKRRY